MTHAHNAPLCCAWRQLTDRVGLFIRPRVVGELTRGGMVKDDTVEARQP